jgi:hypothetical protein
MRKRIYLGMVAGVLVCSSALLAEDKLAVTATTDFYGKYIWRGQDLSDNPVFQPSVAANYGPLTASIWSNMNLSSIHDNRDEFSEVDYSLDYTAAVPGVDVLKYSLGSIYYDFPTQRMAGGKKLPATTEVYGGLALAIPYVNPSFKIYRDVETYNGSYYTLGIGHTFEKVQEWGEGCYSCLCLGASVGYGDSTYNKGYWGYNTSAFNDLTVSASYPITMGAWTLKPSLNYVTLVSDNIRATDAYGETSSDYLFAGMSISRAF